MRQKKIKDQKLQSLATTETVGRNATFLVRGFQFFCPVNSSTWKSWKDTRWIVIFTFILLSPTFILTWIWSACSSNRCLGNGHTTNNEWFLLALFYIPFQMSGFGDSEGFPGKFPSHSLKLLAKIGSSKEALNKDRPRQIIRNWKSHRPPPSRHNLR